MYDLPFGKSRRFSTGNWIDRAIGGWYVSGIYTASSGLPQTVVQGFQVFGAGAIFGTGTGAIPLTKPNFGNSVHTGVAGSGGVGTTGNPATRGSGVNAFSNPEAVFKSFRPLNIAADGRSGRSVLRGFSRWNLDLSIGKLTTIKERVKFGITADFFNVFNHSNFTNPFLDFTNPASFGVVTSTLTGSERQIQLGARIEF